MSDPVWVTYAEAAERLGISVEGVRLKVKRDQKLGKDAKLRVRRDNSGRMLLAWDDALLDQRGTPRGIPHVGEDVGTVGVVDAGAIEALTKLLAQQHADHVAAQAQQRTDHQAELEQVRADHAAELERIRNELERTRQDAERQDRLHREQRVEVEHLLKALVERVEADQARLIEERDHLRNDLQEARAGADDAKADQVRIAQNVAGMFDELRALAEKHAELHADRARLEAELERARRDADRQRADHTAGLEQVRDELDRTRQDAGLWREEADRERARIANLQADVEHTERELARLRAELEQARRPWWRRLWGS
jgi:DNA repair exonuclease SbcCD ATPase subunit